MSLLGIDIGSSSVKASLIETQTGKCLASAFYPKTEAPIISLKAGWAEQRPEMWWENVVLAIREVTGLSSSSIEAIGISYQMHGLVCLDSDRNVLRPSIIWCDSRAIPYGAKAFNAIGKEKCLSELLNSPGNFTAAKLAWVKDNEPELFRKIDKVMLPGDFIGMKLTGEICTTIEGLSEGIFWNFKKNEPSEEVLDYFGFSKNLFPEVRPTFAEHGRLTPAAAMELGLEPGIPVTYRAGDQPNNALSLNVMNPGEIASTAGTSGVVYGINATLGYDPLSRVNIFAHVNHTLEKPRLGVLLCINGTGILNSWIRRNVMPDNASYGLMNEMASEVPIGSDGVCILPFGNGAERMLGNADIGCRISGLNFNIHDRRHLMRAAQEGIAFSFKCGIKIMESMGISVSKIHAGNANMFLSPLFRETLAGVTGARIELYDTDGAAGAAKGAGIGAGIYKDSSEAFSTLKQIAEIEPDPQREEQYNLAYGHWKEELDKSLYLKQ